MGFSFRHFHIRKEYRKILYINIYTAADWKLSVDMLTFLILPPDKMPTISAAKVSKPSMFYGTYEPYELDWVGIAEMVGNLTKT